jgi:dTDP-glucose 4,6-dehydratase
MLSNHDYRVTNLDKLTYAGNLENLRDIEGKSRYKFIKGDIADRADVEAAFSERVDGVISFAAETHVDRSILDPDAFVATNITGTYRLLEAARKGSVGRFVQISTDEVYGSGDPLLEQLWAVPVP